MDPTEKYWTKKYLEIRAGFNFDSVFLDNLSSQQRLYKYLQPSGLIYGHPIELPDAIEFDTSEWPVKNRLEVILYEALLATFLFKNETNNYSTNDANDEIKEFYSLMSPDISKKNLFQLKPKDNFIALERMLTNRVKVKAEWNKSFHKAFFHNILLFSDIITFDYFIDNKGKADLHLADYIKKFHKQIIYLLSIIINLNKKTKEDNLTYFNHFVESTFLNEKERKLAVESHNKSSKNEFSVYFKNANWITKKYFLDIAVLSVWADKSVSLLESEFLDQLAEQINLDPLEIESSGFAVESYVLQHWNKVHYLQDKQSYLALSKRIVVRMKNISKKYASYIKKEIAEDKELIYLLKTAQDRPLSIDEKDKVRQQLVDVLKSIPAFVVLAMPMAFLTVPVLLKILPAEFFPSSFNPNALNASRTHGRQQIIEG